VDSSAVRDQAGWVQAGDLRVGDHVRTASGRDLVVTSLLYQVGTAHVYTLTVAIDHTFFVGSTRVLVHNCDVGTGPDRPVQLSLFSQEELESLGAAGGQNEGLGTQLHHYATNKSARYTPAMENIAQQYGLGLDEPWNTEVLPHLGRHPDEYHDFVLRNMLKAEEEAGEDTSMFLDLFEKYVKALVRANPDLLYKRGWP
jgi:hypothetical protein